MPRDVGRKARPAKFLLVRDGARLALRGSTQSPRALLVGGGPLVGDYLGPLEALARGVFESIRWDARGSGESYCSQPSTLNDHVDDMEAIRVASDVESWILVGHSWGTVLAIEYALRFPKRVEALVLISGIGTEWMPWQPIYSWYVRRRLEQWGLGERFSFLSRRRDTDESTLEERMTLTKMADYALLSSASCYAQQHVWRVLAEWNPFAAASIMSETADRQLHGQMTADSVRIRCPISVIHGTHDPRPWEVNLGLLNATDASLVLLDECGHAPWEERPRDLVNAMAEFVGRL